MPKKLLLLTALLFISGFSTAQLEPDFWTETSASTSSIRSADGQLVSSDTIVLAKNRIALITYWRVPHKSTHLVYRCVDIQTKSFKQVEQRCWKELLP